MLEPVERRLAGQGGAIRPACGELAGDRGQRRVVPQLIVVDQILVAERQGKHALADQSGHAVLHLVRRAMIGKAGGKPPDQANGPVGSAQEQCSGIRGDGAAVE